MLDCDNFRWCNLLLVPSEPFDSKDPIEGTALKRKLH